MPISNDFEFEHNELKSRTTLPQIWTQPHYIKIYEALGTLADNRIKIVVSSDVGIAAHVYSSSGNKYYTVLYSPKLRAITSNDNGSFFKGYLGYPTIALLMKLGDVKYNKDVADLLIGIPWKDINQRFKNDFKKTEAFILQGFENKGVHVKPLVEEVERISLELCNVNLYHFGENMKPPLGY